MTAPLRAADSGTLAVLRAALADAGYTAEAVAEPRRLHAFLPQTEEIPIASSAGGTGERLPALVKLLALGRRLPVAQAGAALAPVRLEALEATGLTTLIGEEVVANYRLLPYEGLLLACDGRRPADSDVVSAFTDPSLALARLTPRGPRRSMLDLGTGSGILALLSAHHCERVTAVDVNPRALMFAAFNARLNDADKVELLHGSCFAPVGERRFDLIVSNPPYVVSPDHEFAYRDSGMPAGALVEQLCRAMPSHLQVDGVAILLASWPHASEEDWAAAPTGWLRSTGCDALILCHGTVDPLDHAVRWNVPPGRFLEPGGLRETVARWHRYYRSHGIGAISFGAVVLRTTPGAPWVTALKAPTTPGDVASAQLLRLFDGQDLLRSVNGDDRALLARSFSLPDGIDISQRFQWRGGGFVAHPAVVKLSGGLGVSAALDRSCGEERPVIARDPLWLLGSRPLSRLTV